MTLILGVAVPVLLLVLTIVQSWTFGVGLVAYVGVILWSETARKLGRVGGVFAPRGKPVVLGGGWSWILRRRLFPPNFIVCERGRCASQLGWWHAGTTIREVQETLAREEGRTLAGHPSILSATLGGWIGSKSHGTGGSLWTPTMGRVVVEEGKTRRTLPSKSHVNIDTMIVRKVEILSVPNVVCERRVTYLVSERDVVGRLFETPTHLRAVFVDRHQSMCVTWHPTRDQTTTTERETFPPLWLLFTLHPLARRGWDTERWTRRMTLSNANDFAPDPPFLFATAAMATHTNFEVYVRETTTPALVWRICSEFQELFATSDLRGRLELRFGHSIQFLDFDVMRFVGNTDVIFDCLRKIYGPDVPFTLHLGKAQVRIP